MWIEVRYKLQYFKNQPENNIMKYYIVLHSVIHVAKHSNIFCVLSIVLGTEVEK